VLELAAAGITTRFHQSIMNSHIITRLTLKLHPKGSTWEMLFLGSLHACVVLSFLGWPLSRRWGSWIVSLTPWHFVSTM